MRWPQVQYSICQMLKIINMLIRKDKQRKTLATLPLHKISSSQGMAAALDLDDTISTSPIPIFIKYKPNVGLFELLTNKTGMTINVISVNRLQENIHKMCENDNGSV